METEIDGVFRLYRRIFDTARDAVLVLKNGAITECNAQALSMFGCEREQLVGNSPIRFLPEQQADGTRSSDLVRRYDDQLQREGHVGFELIHRRRDGKPFLADVSLDLLPNAAADGSDLSLAQLRDITESRKIEHDLRLTSAQFKAIIESIPFDLWISDMQNRNFLQNRCSKELWGETHGVHYSRIAQTGEIFERWKKSNDRAMKGEVAEMEISYEVNGALRHFRNIVAPINDEDEIIGIVGINIDITDYRVALQKLQKSLDERDILLKEVHHRVKNNLQIISSIINLKLGDLPAGGSAEWELFHDIENRIASMALIHEQLYNSASFTAISMPLYIERLVETIRASFSTVAAGVDVKLDCGELTLDIDMAIPLGLILNELITNSFKHAFSSRGGRLSIDFHRRGDGYRLELSDDGAGAPADPGLTESRGLGITLIRHLSAQLNGTVVFDGSGGFSAVLEFPQP